MKKQTLGQKADAASRRVAEITEAAEERRARRIIFNLCSLCEDRPIDGEMGKQCAICRKFVADFIPTRIITRATTEANREETVKLVMRHAQVDRERAKLMLGLGRKQRATKSA